jgi:hypothetical protein
MGEEFQLPLGVSGATGVVKSVVLRAMTAGTRRKMLNRETAKNAAKALTSTLMDCCESLGGAPPTERDINNLVLGDRDYMLFEIRRLSLGNIINASTNCPRCQEKVEFQISMEDVPIRRLELGKDYELENTLPVFTVSDPAIKVEARCRFPNAIDQMGMLAMMKSDPLGANYLLYSRVLREWKLDGVPVQGPYTQAFVDSMSLPEIEWFEKVFVEKQPGPDWAARIPCTSCEHPMILDLNDTDFLFKTQV